MTIGLAILQCCERAPPRSNPSLRSRAASPRRFNIAVLVLLLSSASTGAQALPLAAEKVRTIACQSHSAELFTREIERLGLKPVSWTGGDDPTITQRAEFKSTADNTWATFALSEISMGKDEQGNRKFVRRIEAQFGIEGGTIDLAKSYLESHKDLFQIFHAPTISYGAGYIAKWTVHAQCGVKSMSVGYDRLLDRTFIGWGMTILPETH